MPSPASNDTQETCPSFIIFCSGYPRYHPCCFAIATTQQISAVNHLNCAACFRALRATARWLVMRLCNYKPIQG